jgi:2-methylisocitrate lyase-like PEP mutase family enzyme
MASEDQQARAAQFLSLHHGPGMLVLPNAWDCVSARLFEQAGFPALATTSGGCAAVLGYPDGQKVSAAEMLELAGRMARSVAVPVTADLEGGYGETPEAVASVVRHAIEAGLVGGNVEDGRGPGKPLRDAAYQCEVMRAVREAAAVAGISFVLNARVDVFLYGSSDAAASFTEAVQRANAYHEAGADCVFFIGLRDRDTIARIVPEIRCPVNLMAGHGAPGIAELEQLGVARVTFGSGMMRAILPLLNQIAREAFDRGPCAWLDQEEFTHAAVNQLFQKP